jgi:hypothetical protein
MKCFFVRFCYFCMELIQIHISEPMLYVPRVLRMFCMLYVPRFLWVVCAVRAVFPACCVCCRCRVCSVSCVPFVPCMLRVPTCCLSAAYCTCSPHGACAPYESCCACTFCTPYGDCLPYAACAFLILLFPMILHFKSDLSLFLVLTYSLFPYTWVGTFMHLLKIRQTVCRIS